MRGLHKLVRAAGTLSVVPVLFKIALSFVCYT